MARASKRIRDERRFGRPERLIDFLLDEKFSCPEIIARDEEIFEEYLRGARAALEFCRWAKVFDIQNVYEYAEAFKFGNALDFRRDFASVRLPYKSMFFEFSSARSFRNGVLAMESEDVEGTRQLMFTHFHELPNGGCFGPFANSFVTTDLDGNIIEEPYTQIPWQPIFGTEWSEVRADLAGGHQAPTVLLAVSFMNCKNVVQVEHDPDRAVNRERRKAGLKPFVRYHTIDIEPMKRVLRTEGNVESEGLKRALHICRGHFATYSEEKPLFGRVAGTFWVPAHVRGSAKEGVVFSDYKVGAPK